MKKLIMINGVPGVGKTTTCKALNQALAKSVWLDGDWCWMMNPFAVNEENKAMVEDNITYLLRNFLTNSTFEYVIFSWVIPKEYIFDVILDKLKDLEFELHKFTLICSAESLQDRMKLDNRSGARIKDSKKELAFYMAMDTVKIDTTEISVREAADIIRSQIR